MPIAHCELMISGERDTLIRNQDYIKSAIASGIDLKIMALICTQFSARARNI
jgi:hypothetical protein